MEVPKTFEELHKLGSRQEGRVFSVKSPPDSKSAHGFIEVPAIGKRLFFQERLSGIPKREAANIDVGTTVQFSVGRGEKGFFAKGVIIQVCVHFQW